jgi:predicted transport protein
MTTKTSGEIEKEFIDNLKASTKKDLDGWSAEIRRLGITKRNDIINALKNDYAFGHMNASLLAGIYLNGGKPVYGSTDDLLENQFAKAESMREIYDAVINFVKQNFPGVTVLPKKTYVSILEKREFAAINIKPKELRIGFDLGDRPFDDVVTKSKLTGPMPRISHMVVVTNRESLNEDLITLLRESHSRTHS